jgi:hypothetical protein
MKITAPAGFFDFSRAIIRVNAHTTTGSRFNHLLVTMTDASGFFSLARFFSASFPFSVSALFAGKQTVDLGSSRSRA